MNNLIFIGAYLRQVAMDCFLANDGQGGYGERIQNAITRIEDLQARCEELGALETMTDEESTDFDEASTEIESLVASIKRWERLENTSTFLTQTQPGSGAEPTNPEPQNTGRPRLSNRNVPANQRGRIESPRDRSTGGYTDFGEFALDVVNACHKVNPTINDRLKNAPTTYGNETVGQDGGFAVPDDFRNEIWQQIIGMDDTIMNMCDEMPTSSNVLKIPADETTPWDSSGGIQVYWPGESGQITQSKISLKMIETPVNKVAALVPMTDEVLDDAPALSAYLGRKMPEKMAFAIDNKIINGTGGGTLKGILNSGALISVAKETSQVADTIVRENIDKMYNRMLARYRTGAVWLGNQDIEPQLELLQGVVTNVAGTENVGGWPLYMPPGGIASSPNGTLKGRPVIYHEAMQTLGDLGDLLFVNLKQYQIAKRQAGFQVSTSMHLWFDYDVEAFKVTFRVGGQTWASAPVSSLNSSNTYSAFVGLAERA